MAITRVEIKDYLVFKGALAIEFCPGVNVLIGGNGTGKTTLLKCLSELTTSFTFTRDGRMYLTDNEAGSMIDETTTNERIRKWGKGILDGYIPFLEYIPEKDILEHAKGLFTFIMEKQTGFSRIYRDVLISAHDVPTQEQNEMQKSVGEKIIAIIGGEVDCDKGDDTFYIVKADGSRIPFVNEASGYKRLGFLGLLVSCGKLVPNSVLVWDEPENSLNPELVPKLVDIFLELSRNGVQVFIATHSEILASYFDVNRKDDDEVIFVSLYKENDIVKANTSDRFDLLTPNKLTEEPVKLYERKLDRGLGDE